MENRRTRVSEAQWRIILDFMERNPSLARVRCYNNTTRGRAESLRLWSMVAERLNAVRSGTTKSPKEWSIYVSNYKSKLKRIVSENNTDTSTGETYLSDAEQRFLAIMGEGFGQNTSWVKVHPLLEMEMDPLLQPSTPPHPQTADVKTEEEQEALVTEDVPFKESERNRHYKELPIRNTDTPSIIRAIMSAPITAKTDAASTVNPPQHTRRVRYRSRPLGPLNQARRILSQMKRQRAVTDAATAEALNVIGQNLGRLADAAEIYLSHMQCR